MLSKKFVCKITAALLSAAMAVASAPMNSQIWVSAAETEQMQNEFQFGSAGTKLLAGEYSLPVSLMNASDITKASMAGSCIKDGKLIVNQDGTADITIGLQAVTVMGVTAWAGEWSIYKGDFTGDKQEVTSTTDEEGNVGSITFHLPDHTMDGVYTDMFVSAMNTTMQAYFAFDFASLVAGDSGNTAEKKNGSARVEQFGGYDVNVAVSILEGLISGLEIEGDNFDGTYADFNKTKLQSAADVLKASYVGKSVTNAKEIEGVDAVSGATYSSEAIRSAVFNALDLQPGGEEITLPTQKLEEGVYQVDIAFYTDNVKHSLVENDKAEAEITVDANGNMTLTTAVVNGTAKEPLYYYEFNGYYEGNDVTGTLNHTAQVKKEDIDYSDDVFGEEEQVVTEVSFPLEGDFAEEYVTNASVYVPAMKNLNGEVSGVQFTNGRFSTDCFVRIYWNSLKKAGSESGFGSQGTELAEGIYTLPISMRNAADTSKDSMAGSCLQGAVLAVKADGSAEVTVNLTSVSIMGQTAWSSDWKIYQGQSTDSDLIDAEVTQTNEEGNVTQIAFALPDNQADGVYVNMSSGGHANNAYLALDFVNAVVQEKGLADGIYAVEGTMYKPDLRTKSMADAAFNHNVMMTVEDGKATLTINFKGMEITGIFGYLGSLKYYDTGYQKDGFGSPAGTLKDVTVKSVQKYRDGVVISDSFGTDYPDVVSFEVIPEALEDGIVPLQVFVPIMESITAGTGQQNVYLKLDLDSLRKTTAEDDLFKETEEAPENPGTHIPEDPGTDKPGDPGVSTPEEPGTDKPGDPGASIPEDPGTDKPDPNPEADTPNPGTSNQGSTTTNPPSSTGTSETNTSKDDGSKTPSTSILKVGKTVKVSGHTYKVTAKGKVAFTKCKANAKTVKVPAAIKVKGVTYKVTSVAKNAMKNNKKLTKVTLGKNVTTIGKNAFKGCKKLKIVKMAGSLSKKKKTALKKQIKKAGITAKVKIK